MEIVKKNYIYIVLLYNVMFNCSVLTAGKLPILYSKHYNITFLGLENLHPFDSKKYGKVATYISTRLNRPIDTLFHEPQGPITDEELLQFHTKSYLESLKKSVNIAEITAVLPLRFLPNFLLQWTLLKSIRYATKGTIEAAELAWNNKHYAINLGGGFHHARYDGGGGFCIFGDIQLAMLHIWKKKPNAKILYIDLDAHQGDGVELGLKKYIQETDPSKSRLIVFDIYGENNYPHDNEARTYIQYPRPVTVGRKPTITDDVYLEKVAELEKIIAQEKPDFIFYNAGTDVYEHDSIGKMKLTKKGIITRDQRVFEYAKKARVPLVMTLSGGYTKESAQIIGSSIVNIIQNIWT